MNIRVLVVLFLTISSASFSQNVDSIKQSKIGIYQSYQELQKGKPSIIKPFKIERQYYILNIDTVVTGYTYRFIDSTPIVKNAFGLYDGNQFYIMHKKGALEKMTSEGKFPYKIYYAAKDEVKGADIIDAAASAEGAVRLLDKMISSPKDVIIYFNKKGKAMEATPQSIGVLLRGDKDLLKEFEKEKKYGSEVYIKYLQKMNERYPL